MSIGSLQGIDVEAAPAIDRESFLASVEDAKSRALIASLGEHTYDLPLLFPVTKGWGVRKQIKNRVRLLKHIEPLLNTLLFPDERIRFITRGTLNSFVEQYFMGIFAYLLNRTTFVVTDLRVILLNTNGKGKPKRMKWQIPYHQITKFSAGGFISSSVKFKLADKKRFSFSGTPSADRKLLRQYVNERMDMVKERGLPFPHFQGRDHLCPTCCSPVEPKASSCSTCNEVFLRPRTPAIMSAFLPGLGDFYLGHSFLAVLEILGYGLSWAVIVGLFAQHDPQALTIAVVILSIEHVFDALLTHHVAKKGLLPQSAAWKG